MERRLGVAATVVSVCLTVGGLTMWRLVFLEGGVFTGVGWGAGLPTLVFLPWGIALGLAMLAFHYRGRGRPAHCGRGG